LKIKLGFRREELEQEIFKFQTFQGDFESLKKYHSILRDRFRQREWIPLVESGLLVSMAAIIRKKVN